MQSGWRMLGDAWLLKWVSEYQSLLAGLAALVGGAFVILAAKYQMRLQLRLRTAEQNLIHTKILNLISVEFGIIGELIKNNPIANIHANMKWLDDVSIDLAGYDPELLEIARKSQAYLAIFAHHLKLAEKSTEIISEEDMIKFGRSASLFAFAAGDIFRQAAIIDDKVDELPDRIGLFDPEVISGYLDEFSMVRSDLVGIQHYFDWPNA